MCACIKYGHCDWAKVESHFLKISALYHRINTHMLFSRRKHVWLISISYMQRNSTSFTIKIYKSRSSGISSCASTHCKRGIHCLFCVCSSRQDYRDGCLPNCHVGRFWVAKLSRNLRAGAHAHSQTLAATIENPLHLVQPRHRERLKLRLAMHLVPQVEGRIVGECTHPFTNKKIGTFVALAGAEVSMAALDIVE